MSNPLKWHGGKTYLAQKIIELIPPHTHYVEPYFGGGAVLFAKPDDLIENHSEVVNDLNGELINFWLTLRVKPQFDKFVRFLQFTPFSEKLFDGSLESFARGTTVDRALNFFIRYRQSRQGLGKDFATLTRNRTRRGMNEQVSSWLSAIDGLAEAHERLQRVVILNTDAISVIKQQDGENTFFYCDPPYLHETRVTTADYEYEMSREQHVELLDTLKSIKGRFLLSGYSSDLYNSYGWTRTEIDSPNHASSAASKEIKTECLWSNYLMPDVLFLIVDAGRVLYHCHDLIELFRLKGIYKPSDEAEVCRYLKTNKINDRQFWWNAESRQWVTSEVAGQTPIITQRISFKQMETNYRICLKLRGKL